MSEKNISIDWMLDAECREMDPQIFFPHDGSGVYAAKRICAECVVKEDCLSYALSNVIAHGVWGGTSERERKAMRKLTTFHGED